MKNISPIRYFGGKTRIVKGLEKYSPGYLDAMISPFGGGCSYEVFTARKGVPVTAYDAYEPLVCYWHYQLYEPELLYKAAMELYPLSDEHHQEIQQTLHQMDHSPEQAACLFALNYSTFCSMGQSAAQSRVWDRFNPDMMARILSFSANNLTVGLADYRDSISRHTDDFMYLDPPYEFELNSKNNKYGNCPPSAFDRQIAVH